MSEIRHLTPETPPRPNGYSHVVSAPLDRILFISGQVPLDAEGQLVGVGDVAAQARQVFENLTRALEAADATWSNVVKLAYFVRDVGEMPAVRSIRDEYIRTEHARRSPAPDGAVGDAATVGRRRCPDGA